jgi:hypothetical protein
MARRARNNAYCDGSTKAICCCGRAKFFGRSRTRSHWFYLSLIAESRAASAPSISQAFVAFCQERLMDPNFVLGELLGILLLIARSFRNPAAHTQIIEFSQLRDFVSLLLATNGADLGILQRVLIATDPPES